MAKYKKIKVCCDACCHKPLAHLGITGKGKSAGGFFITDENDISIYEGGIYLGEMTPPQAEYSTLIKALDRASAFCRGEVEVWMDSELVVKQMNGDYAIKSENMKPLFHQVKTLESRFSKISYFHHSRESEWGKKADKLAAVGYKKHNTK